MEQSGKPVKEVVIFIDGMTCNSCVCSIESNLRKVAGVFFVRVNLNLKFGYLKFDSGRISPADLVEKIDDMGFEAHQDNSNAFLTASWLKVEGMTCQSCVRHIQSTVGSLIGIHSVSVSLNDKLATVLHDPSLISDVAVRGAIDDIGFEAEVESLASGVEIQNHDANAPLLNVDATLASQETDEFVELAATRRSASLLSSRVASDVCKCSISVQGMTCQSCVKNIESRISDVMGVISIDVSLEQKKADVTFMHSKISGADIASLIDDMGFDASLINDATDVHMVENVLCGNGLKSSPEFLHATTLCIAGMHCQSCVRTIEGQLLGTPGVKLATVLLESSRCQILHDNSMVTADNLCKTVEQSGKFTASVLGELFVFFLSVASVIYYLLERCLMLLTWIMLVRSCEFH